MGRVARSAGRGICRWKKLLPRCHFRRRSVTARYGFVALLRIFYRQKAPYPLRYAKIRLILRFHYKRRKPLAFLFGICYHPTREARKASFLPGKANGTGEGASGTTGAERSFSRIALRTSQAHAERPFGDAPKLPKPTSRPSSPGTRRVTRPEGARRRQIQRRRNPNEEVPFHGVGSRDGAVPVHVRHG